MSTWHASPQLLARFANEPELIDNATAASIEAHVLSCKACREAVADAVEPGTVAMSWDAIVDRIDRPRASIPERVLAWFLPGDVARVVAATPALRLSWLAAAAAVIAGAVAASRSVDDLTPFLALAPLVPLAGVAFSFGPAPDPAGEAGLATPMHGAGLVLRRTIAVLVTSVGVLLAGSAALPGLEWRTIGWLLPAIALSAAALALSTWFAPLTATIGCAVAWELVILLAGILDRGPRSLEAGPLFGPAGQVAFALVTIAALAVLVTRQSQLSTLEAR